MSIDEQIDENKGLIWSQLNRLHLAGDADAESIGYEALYNAVKTFDESAGFKLSTYATCCIYNALGSYIRTLNRKRQIDTVSYNNIADDSNEYITLFASEDCTEQSLLRNELHCAVRSAVTDAIDSLPEGKQKSIILAWCKSEFKATYVDIAKSTGVSQPYVSQVLSTFMYKLKRKLGGLYYD